MDDMRSSIRRLAGEKLSGMLREKHEPPSEESVMVLHLIGDITSAFADDSEDISIRIHAAMVMEHLCTIDDDIGLFALKKEQTLFGFFDKKVEGIFANTIMNQTYAILTT